MRALTIGFAAAVAGCVLPLRGLASRVGEPEPESSAVLNPLFKNKGNSIVDCVTDDLEEGQEAIDETLPFCIGSLLRNEGRVLGNENLGNFEDLLSGPLPGANLEGSTMSDSSSVVKVSSSVSGDRSEIQDGATTLFPQFVDPMRWLAGDSSSLSSMSASAVDAADPTTSVDPIPSVKADTTGNHTPLDNGAAENETQGKENATDTQGDIHASGAQVEIQASDAQVDKQPSGAQVDKQASGMHFDVKLLIDNVDAQEAANELPRLYETFLSDSEVAGSSRSLVSAFSWDLYWSVRFADGRGNSQFREAQAMPASAGRRKVYIVVTGDCLPQVPGKSTLSLTERSAADIRLTAAYLLDKFPAKIPSKDSSSSEGTRSDLEGSQGGASAFRQWRMVVSGVSLCSRATAKLISSTITFEKKFIDASLHEIDGETLQDLTRDPKSRKEYKLAEDTYRNHISAPPGGNAQVTVADVFVTEPKVAAFWIARALQWDPRSFEFLKLPRGSVSELEIVNDGRVSMHRMGSTSHFELGNMLVSA